MGMVLGKITVETPKYKTLTTSPDYEIREHPPSVVAEVTYDPSELNNNKDGGFTILANYIGALGNPQNKKPEKIAMTAPVITTTSEKIAMTAPVITKGGNTTTVTMRFVLPDKYQKAEEAPQPLDERVVVREEGGKKYGVVKFSGVASDQVVNDKVRVLRESLERDGFTVVGEFLLASDQVVNDKVRVLKESLERDGFTVVGEFLLARYNPPWTLPPFRTNEVMIPVE